MMAGKLGGLLAMLRILAGGALLYSGVSRLLDDEFLYGGLLHQLTEMGTAFPFYQSLLIRFVELHQTAFAFAVAIGEILVGLSLLFGLLVSWGALGGVFLVVNFALATTAHNVPGMIAHAAMAACLLLLGRVGAGLKWGLDGWLIQRVKDSLVLFPMRLGAPR